MNIAECSSGARRALVLAGLFAALACGAGLASAQGEDREEQRSKKIPAWLQEALSSPPQLKRSAAQAEALAAKAPDPASRHRFGSLHLAEAAAVAQRAFPQILAEPVGVGPQLQRGERLLGYASPNVARIELPSAKRAVAESALPMLSETPSGQMAPTELSLRRRGEAIEPANPLVELRIPSDLSRGVELPETAGLRLTPVNAAGAPLRGADAQIEGATAFFANTQPDADTLVKPLPLGFETHTILRSPAAPEALYFQLSAQGELDLLAQENGSVVVEVDGAKLAAIAAPSAIDAAGRAVALEMELEGDRLALSVEHSAGGYEYPIAVDPTVQDVNSFSSSAGNWAQWGAGWGYLEGGALRLYLTGASYGLGHAWGYVTQGASRIYQLDANVSSSPSGAFANILGIVNTSSQWEGSANLGANFTAKAETVCAAGGCLSTSGSNGNAAIYELVGVQNDPWASATGDLNSATVKIAQDSAPTVGFDTASKEIEGKKNALHSSQWVRKSDQAVVRFTATDPGIGIFEQRIVAEKAGWSTSWAQIPPAYCNGVQCEPTFTKVQSVKTLPDGAHTVEAGAKNATGAAHAATGTVRVDSVAPSLALEGLPSDGTVASGRKVGLKLKAADGSAPTTSSGVKAAASEFKLDGATLVSKATTKGCSPGPCEATVAETSIEAPVGYHVVSVKVEDNAGNVKEEEFPFVVQSGASESIGPGSLSLSDGEFTMLSNDVSAGVAGAGLSVSRTYQSRHLNPGSPASSIWLDKSWQLSLGGWRGITRLQDGDAVLSDPRGRPFVFDDKGSATPMGVPPGYQGWALEHSGEGAALSFELTNPSGGVTSFERPEGKGELFVPTSFVGPGGSEETTFEFESSSSGPRPVQVIGPTPPGVECEPELVRGCRALSFVYAGSTTASGHGPGQWGDFSDRLKAIELHAWDPEEEEMVAVELARYAYDSAARLRAVWDPRVSPALKTSYGYGDASSYRVQMIAPPGQLPWVLEHDTSQRLASVSRPTAGTVDLPEEVPAVISAPKVTSTPQASGYPVTVDPGEWSNDPSGYLYQWSKCAPSCELIPGATQAKYYPAYEDLGATLKVQVTAVNVVGSSAATASSEKVVGWRYVKSCEFPAGEEEGELTLGALATGADGSRVFALDTINQWVVSFVKAPAEPPATPSNCFMGLAGAFGGFSEASDIAVSEAGEVFVLDKATAEVHVFNEEGEPLGQFGSFGSGNGQLNEPTGIGMQGEYLWVADTGNNRLQRFKTSGSYQSQLSYYWVYKGMGISEPIPFSEPFDVVPDYTDQMYFTQGEDLVKLQHLFGGWKGVTVEPESTWATALPRWLAISNSPAQVLASDSRFSQVGKSEVNGVQAQSAIEVGRIGELTGLATGPDGELYVSDAQKGVLGMWRYGHSELACRSEYEQEYSYLYEEGTCADGSNEFEGDEPAEQTAINVRYDVPFAGSVPYAMSSNQVARWGQKKAPTFATALIPSEGNVEPGNYDRATIYYMDTAGRAVNTAMPGGRIETNEYDKHENLIRNLTPANRAQALALGGGAEATAARAREIDTQYTYDGTGAKLLSLLGPKRDVVLSNGTEAQRRLRTQYQYESHGGSKDLIVKQTESAEGSDPRISTFSYGGQEGLGWELELPTSTKIDVGGLNLETRTVYDPDTGAVLETTKPADPAGGDPSATRTVYYSAGAAAIEACGQRPEWHGLPCRTEPADQPDTQGLPELAVTTTTYNLYNQPLLSSSVFGEESRAVSIDYDAAGRPVSSEMVASEGISLPAVSTEYDEQTGMAVAVHNETEYLLSEYDSLGRLTSYTDADELTSTYSYDAHGRPVESYDGKGTRTSSYDPTTGDLVKVSDSGVGAFTATYDADGRLLSETAPNGLKLTRSYDPSGALTEIKYVKSTNCAEDCTWYSEARKSSVFGQTRARSSTLGAFAYTYDGAGRLTKATQTPTGEGCTTRLYGYDANTNRTAVTTRAPGEGGACASSGGATQSFEYDEADRLIDAGTSYNAFGDVSALSAPNAGGSALSATYYADSRAATLSQGAATVSYGLDPVGRQRLIETAGGSETETIAHFSGSGDAPSWTSQDGGAWTRYVGGIGGGLNALTGSGEGAQLQIANLHGDIVGTVANDQFATKLELSAEATEYGAPQGEDPPAKYSWLGSAQRSTDLASGVISMGARTYVPAIGRFLQTDPVPGGGPNPYAYTWGDPVNQTDLSGQRTPVFPTWLREAMGSSPAMPPPPPPPVWEVELEYEEELFGGGAGGGRQLLIGSKMPKIPCLVCSVAKKFGEVVVSGGRFAYKQMRAVFEMNAVEAFRKRAVGYAISGISIRTGLHGLSGTATEREQFWELSRCAEGAVGNFIEAASTWKPWKQAMKVGWIAEGCIQQVLGGW